MLYISGSCLLISLVVIQTKFSLAVEMMVFPNCTGQSSRCLTMSSLIVPTDPNVTLVLAPGEHQVSSNLRFSNKNHWEIRGSQSEVTCRTSRYTYSLEFLRNSQVKISGITFLFCRFQFTNSNNTCLFNSKFLNVSGGRAIAYSGGHNVTIDRCTFSNGSRTYYRSYNYMTFNNVKDVHVTRSEFSKISLFSSYVAVMRIFNSGVSIGCTAFADNNLYSNSYLITVFTGSSLYVSNSSFSNNRAGKGIVSIFDQSNVVIVSSAFDKSWTPSYLKGGVVNLASSSASATILACRFVSNQGLLVRASSTQAADNVIVDCSAFPTSTIPSSFVQHDATLCKRHVLGDILLNCNNSICNCKLLTDR